MSVGRSIPRQGINQPIEARVLNKTIHEAQRGTRLWGTGAACVSSTPAGHNIAPNNRVVWMLFQITGTPNGSGGYAWAEVIRVYQSGFQPTGLVGGNDSTQSNFDPAYPSGLVDPNNPLPADGTIYQARRAPTSGEWIFDPSN